MEDIIETDVLVAGGGLAGVFAAISAKKTNPRLSVTLIERSGYSGGMATAGFVFPFMSYSLYDKIGRVHKRLTGGLFKTMLDRMAEEGFTEKQFRSDPCYKRFDSYIMRVTLDEMLIENDVNILYHAMIFKTDTAGSETAGDKKITNIHVATKSGEIIYKTKYVIDATGDGDVCYQAGAEYELGRGSDGLTQPATLNFRLGNLSIFGVNRMLVAKKIKAEKAKGESLTPRNDCLMFLTNNSRERHFNQTRVAEFDFTDPFQLTEAEIEGRKQAKNFIRFLKKKVPGFKNASVTGMASLLGVRESRRIMGEYIITAEDLHNGVKFEDRVALGNYPIDIHDPKGSASTQITRFPKGQYYSLPYRCMVVKGFSNLLVTGRAISTTHEALSAVRIMPICASLGEAAGISVGISSLETEEISLKKLEYGKIQKKIVEFGGIID